MPEIMIEQSKDIINYINMLRLPCSYALKNHMVNMISGIIATEGSKNVSAIYRKVTCNRDRSTGSRFLGEYSWSSDYVDHKRIEHSLKEIAGNVESGTVGFLVLDDTLSKKAFSTKHIEGLGFHNSHTDGNRPMWSHCVVNSHYKISEYSMPMDYKIYLKEENFGKKAKKHFKTKQQLAMELISEFKPITEVTYLLIDAWYTSGKVILHALSKGYHTIGMIKSNRVIYPQGIKISVREFAKFVRKEETCPVTAGDTTYYVYRYEGKINDIENAVILISWSKEDLSDTPTYLVCTDVALTTSTIIEYYQNRWDIEVGYRYQKSSLGFDEYQVRSLKSIKRYWSMVYMTYTFLELFRIANKKSLKLSNLGDTIGYFRKQYMVCIVKYVYACAENCVDIDSTISELGLVA